MNLNQDPTEVVEQLLKRSICSVQVAAILVDDWAIHAWGWNSMGPDGLGIHAECHCMSRANRNRIKNSTMYVAARRRRNNRTVTARPCFECLKIVQYCKKVMYRDKDGTWKKL